MSPRDAKAAKTPVTAQDIYREARDDVRAPMTAFAEAMLKWGFRHAKARAQVVQARRELEAVEDDVRSKVMAEGIAHPTETEIRWAASSACSTNDIVKARRRRADELAEQEEAIAWVVEALKAKRDALSITNFLKETSTKPGASDATGSA